MMKMPRAQSEGFKLLLFSNQPLNLKHPSFIIMNDTEKKQIMTFNKLYVFDNWTVSVI